MKAIGDLPTTVEDIYDDIMNRLGETSSADNDLATCALSWIFHTANDVGARPLHMDELIDLLVTDLSDKKLSSYRSSSYDILAVCKGLVIYDSKSDAVGFPHYTVLEYFRKSKKLKAVSYLAQICLTYLNFDEFEQEECKDQKDLSTRLGKYKAVNFISKYWGYYARASEDDPDVQKAILSLLTSEKKMSAMLEMEKFQPGEEIFSWEDFHSNLSGQTILHVLAKNGLANMCTHLLDGTLVKEEK